jgi:hypothetical protein
MKKKFILFLLIFASIESIQAGDGDKYLSLSFGPVINPYADLTSGMAELNFETETSYHGGWGAGLEYCNRFFLTTTDSTGNKLNHYSVLLGGYYTKSFARFKNANLRWRAQIGVGFNQDLKFTLAVAPCVEYVYTFSSGLKIFILEKNQVSFWNNNKQWLKFGLEVGFKIPL